MFPNLFTTIIWFHVTLRCTINVEWNQIRTLIRRSWFFTKLKHKRDLISQEAHYPFWTTVYERFTRSQD